MILWAALAAVVLLPLTGGAAEPPDVRAEALLRVGRTLAERTHYLEALDLLSEARLLLESSGDTQTRIYGDILFAMAQTKIKGRLHQGFAASYVKSAFKDVQAANRLREKLPDILPQQLAAGYFLEGFIHKKFFARKKKALSCFLKAVNIDPGNSAAKRELSELIGGR